MKGMKGIVVGALLVLMAGCAFQKQAVKLSPQLNVTSSNLGGGKPVAVNVVDERPRATLGTRGVGGIGTQLAIEGNLAETIRNSLIEGLQREGFDTRGPLANQLRVEIRSFDYEINSGFWAGKLMVGFSMKGICIKDGQRPYEQLYRGSFERSIQVVQNEGSNNQYTNQVVSEAINGLLNDKELLRCLAG